ncbi:hypothetical protein FJTKL_04576 [Diaporthe vaccinii]|uniref:Uncharacterized protein n=1 Tax=Diaporthe vaccinii TaxID=105482 RepID=A0ABR4DSG5_9PEZI
MLVAALYMSGKGTAQRRSPLADTEVPGDSVLYNMMLSMLAATFSIFPVTILYAMQRRDSDCSFKKRENQVWVRRAVLVLIWMLGAAEVYASLYGNFDYDHRDYDSDYYRENCDWRGSVHFWDGMIAARCLIIAGPVIWLILTIFVLTGFRIPGILHKPWMIRWRSFWRLGIAWFNLLAMWGILGFFTWVRHKIDVTVGHLNEANNWKFGQVLALATWAPVLFQFIYVFIWGIEDGLGENVPSGYIVQRAGPEPSSQRPTSGKDRSKDPLMSRSEFVEPSLGRGSELEMGIIVRNTRYQPDYHPALERENDKPQQQATDQWHRTGW